MKNEYVNWHNALEMFIEDKKKLPRTYHHYHPVDIAKRKDFYY